MKYFKLNRKLILSMSLYHTFSICFQKFLKITIYIPFLYRFLFPQRFEEREQYGLCSCRSKRAFIHFSDFEP